MHITRIARLFTLMVTIVAASAGAAFADVGIKFGPTFPKFSGDVFDFDTRTGWHAGLFFGGNRDGVVGLQGELNWIRKQAEFDGGLQEIRIDYLQVPVLLRLNVGADSASGVRAFALAGPAIDFKIADELEGLTIDDQFENTDVSLVLGGGIEAARIILEGRYTKGFRRINKLFADFDEIKTQSFTILFGVRFN